MHDACLEVIKAVLQLAIKKRIIKKTSDLDPDIFRKYGRVLVQDSTIIKLPEWLFGEFSGVSNASSQVCEVLLNDEAGTRVRLVAVAVPVDPAIAEERRRKAKKETKGHHPSRAVLDLMDWTIFITTLPKKVDFACLFAIYGLRWRIEIIFKAWKSTMNFHVIHRVSALELRICLTASLITITMGTGHLYKLCYARIYEETGRDLSLMKFSKYISRDLRRLQEICQWFQAGGSPEEHASQSLVKYCCYDKRKRLNYHQKQRLITAP